jgi:hypothetical protein
MLYIVSNEALIIRMFYFYYVWFYCYLLHAWVLLFIFKLRFPPSVSIATDSFNIILIL